MTCPALDNNNILPQWTTPRTKLHKPLRQLCVGATLPLQQQCVVTLSARQQYEYRYAIRVLNVTSFEEQTYYMLTQNRSRIDINCIGTEL